MSLPFAFRFAATAARNASRRDLNKLAGDPRHTRRHLRGSSDPLQRRLNVTAESPRIVPASCRRPSDAGEVHHTLDLRWTEAMTCGKARLENRPMYGYERPQCTASSDPVASLLTRTVAVRRPPGSTSGKQNWGPQPCCTGSAAEWYRPPPWSSGWLCPIQTAEGRPLHRSR
jgi:hypothetical protein